MRAHRSFFGALKRLGKWKFDSACEFELYEDEEDGGRDIGGMYSADVGEKV